MKNYIHGKLKAVNLIGSTLKGTLIHFDNVLLPSVRSVCTRCSGTGRHVNPSIDGHGLSSELDDDDDFREAYLRGEYDTKCEACDGEKVVDEIDLNALSPRMKKRYLKTLEDQRNAETEAYYERRCGA